MAINVGKFIVDNGFTSTFDALVSNTISRYKVPGLSIAVVNKDNTCAKVVTPPLSSLLRLTSVYGIGVSVREVAQ